MSYRIIGKRGSFVVSDKMVKGYKKGDFTNNTGDITKISKVKKVKKRIRLF